MARRKQITVTNDVQDSQIQLLNKNSSFKMKEEYNSIRDSLSFCVTPDGETPCKVFAVTGFANEDSKSITAVNVAIAFAMSGKKTLLLDCDISSPSQSLIWNVELGNGLSEFLLDDVGLQLYNVENLPLNIVFCRDVKDESSSVLGSTKMSQLISACKNSFEYVLLDCSNVESAEFDKVCKFADGIILVAMSAHHTFDELVNAENMIKDANGNFCGVIIDDVGKTAKRSYRYKQ